MDYSIPLSGLNLQALRVAVSANNIVNAKSTALNGSENSSARVPFTPSRVDAISNNPGVGGIVSQVSAGTPLSQVGQTSSFAEIFSATNVNIEEELVNQKIASTAYKANAVVIQKFSELDDTLLSILDSNED
ncbi:flagellar basal body rod C-terminal domain-containing protein [Kiloniella antarctica]|uniref:Flagellar basal body rod C-terminal domain-containing protein n=1 Tax=Kiloniella antarctica TaxID=1550907 RepID=A0ABW5BSI4_9PROT